MYWFMFYFMTLSRLYTVYPLIGGQQVLLLPQDSTNAGNDSCQHSLKTLGEITNVEEGRQMKEGNVSYPVLGVHF
jgi:hypothetical protein